MSLPGQESAPIGRNHHQQVGQEGLKTAHNRRDSTDQDESDVISRHEFPRVGFLPSLQEGLKGHLPRRYDAAAKLDGGRGIAIDTNYDVIITAYAQAAPYDIYTAKYSRVDGSSDVPWALTLDDSGNIYVVGTSYSSIVPDSITLK
jgi:hypothetical protein